jgi:hypothetical protein
VTDALTTTPQRAQHFAIGKRSPLRRPRAKFGRLAISTEPLYAQLTNQATGARAGSAR